MLKKQFMLSTVNGVHCIKVLLSVDGLKTSLATGEFYDNQSLSLGRPKN